MAVPQTAILADMAYILHGQLAVIDSNFVSCINIVMGGRSLEKKVQALFPAVIGPNASALGIMLEALRQPAKSELPHITAKDNFPSWRLTRAVGLIDMYC